MVTIFERGHVGGPHTTIRRTAGGPQTEREAPGEFGVAGSVVFRTLKQYPEVYRAVLAALAAERSGTKP